MKKIKQKAKKKILLVFQYEDRNIVTTTNAIDTNQYTEIIAYRVGMRNL
jgi:hypothetical protein